MRFRLSAWLPALIAACCSNWALALGLGEIKLNSALNQPLNAEIELLQVRELQAPEISVALANSEEFERLGIDRPFFLSDLRFTVDLQAPGGPVVRVTSLKPVREPFLNFVVSARWPSGRLLREYTLLVDLPVFTGGRAQAPAAPARTEPRPAPRQSAPAQAPAPSPTRSAEPRTQPAAPAAGDAGGDTYTVTANDSLWAIASQVRPSRELSVQQTMLALQRLNPDAFIDNNINRLRRGQVLRVPSADEIEALTFQQAVRQVAEQNAAFQNRTPSPEPAAPARPQLDASEPPGTAPVAPAAPEGRVKLSAPSDAAEGGSATGDGRSLEAIELELNQAQEQLDAASRESGELRSRISTMEEQIDTMERLVEVSSEEMRNLELAARQLNEGVTAETPDTVAGETAAPEPAQAESTPPETAAVETPAQPEPAPARAAPARGFVDMLLDNLLWVVLGLAVVVGAVLAVIFLRRRSDDWDDDEFQTLDSDFTYDGSADDVTQVAPSLDPTERAVVADGAVAGSGTALEQADALIAAGDYDAAAGLLESELRANPESEALRLKALEVYAALGDHQRFDSHYAETLRRDDAVLAERARLMREGMLDAPPFNPALFGLAAAGVAAGEFELSDDTLQFDLPPDDVLDIEAADVLEPELEVESEPELVVSAPAATQAADDDFDLNFDDIDLQLEGGAIPADSLADLDAELGGFDFDDLGEPEPEVAEVAAAGDDVVIDEASIDGLDLDFSDLEETAAAPPPVTGALFDDHNEIDASHEEFDAARDEFDAALELDLSPELASGDDTGSLAENFLGEEDLLLELDEDETGDLSMLGSEPDAEVEALEILRLDGDLPGSTTFDFIETHHTGLEEEVIPPSDRLKPDAEDAPVREPVSGRATTVPFALPDVDPEADDDSQLGFLSDGDETATKLDLARAYLDMGDADGAKDILDEIMEEGDQDQRREAETLLAKLG